MMGASNLRRVSAMSTSNDVPSMWGNILGQYPPTLAITAAAPGNQGAWLVSAERAEWLFANRSNRPGDDMKDELRADSDPLRGAPGVLHRTSCGSFVSQLHSQSALVSKECSPTCMPTFERKNKSYRCSSLAVSTMYPCFGERSGSKSMMVLLKRNCTLHWHLTISC